MMIKTIKKLDENFIIKPELVAGPKEDAETAEITEPIKQIDFRDFFDDDKPVELEIGCGKGTMMVHLAKENPEANFVGIEWASKFYRYCADRIRRWNLRNAKMLRTDAKELVISGRLKPESLQALHVYFPDPWPKKRHNKRRLLTAEFCQAAVKLLVPGGYFYIATDHQNYSEQVTESLKAVPELTPCEYDSPAGNEILTNYEAKFVKEGRNIYRFAMKKV